MKKFVALLLGLAMTVSLVACGSTETTEEAAEETTEEATEEAEEATEEAAEADYSDLKIGLLLTGSANDGGWSQMAADAVQTIADEYGCTTNFAESIQASDYESNLRGYADQGYDIIVAHGGEWQDVCALVAPDYPDIKFINTSVVQDSGIDNLLACNIGGNDFGFVTGVIMGLATETNKIGLVGALELDTTVYWAETMEKGAQYVNPDAELTAVWTGSYDDASKAKQAVDSLVEAGCDVVTENCDAAGIGAIQECDAKGIMNVGSVSNYEEYGENCFITVMEDAQLAIEVAVEETILGNFTPGVKTYCFPENVCYLTDYRGTYADALTDEEKAQVEEIVARFVAGEVTEDFLAEME